MIVSQFSYDSCYGAYSLLSSIQSSPTKKKLSTQWNLGLHTIRLFHCCKFLRVSRDPIEKSSAQPKALCLIIPWILDFITSDNSNNSYIILNLDHNAIASNFQGQIMAMLGFTTRAVGQLKEKGRQDMFTCSSLFEISESC